MTVIDVEQPANNVFHVTDEWRYTNGLYRWDKKSNPPGVTFLINGIPVAIVETKGARRTNSIDEALKVLSVSWNNSKSPIVDPH